jgi:general secretion pathway protein G
MPRQCRHRRRGVTLFEVLIVIAILSLLSSGIALAVLHYLEKARVDTAKLETKQILTAVNLWRADHPGECPSVAGLVNAGALQRSERPGDPWDGPYRVECSGDAVTVASRGKDQQWGTEDDIRAPPDVSR